MRQSFRHRQHPPTRSDTLIAALAVTGVLLMAVLPVRCSPVLPQQNMQTVADFGRHWDRYARKLFGCPPTGPTTQETCSPNRAAIDYREYRETRNLAKKLFDLKDAE